MVVRTNNKVMELRSTTTTPLVDEENTSREILRRGYSQMALNGKASIKGPSIHTNVLIKKILPARGVVSSNPKRVERLLTRASEEGLLTNVQEHTNVGWGVTIYTAAFSDVPIFVAGVPMGAAGSGFAFFEMFAAGAQAVSCCLQSRGLCLRLLAVQSCARCSTSTHRINSTTCCSGHSLLTYRSLHALMRLLYRLFDMAATTDK